MELVRLVYNSATRGCWDTLSGWAANEQCMFKHFNVDRWVDVCIPYADTMSSNLNIK